MARLELLTVLIAMRALLENNTEKTLELVNGLLEAVKKLPPGHKLELVTVLFAVKTLLEAGTPDKATALIDEILSAMQKDQYDNKGE